MELILFIFITFDKFSYKITNQNSRFISFFAQISEQILYVFH
ncbi:hypothetical protein HMPREF9083_0582 [Dialister micraerophilus DSM 19965]|uniref:Uncharacterized protein n=1 Tax=Dialister micraerophilus DSM 19965 TaxID=888062 RepID=F2BWL5_9FIRM|nr:hypothetical protein HMPREF9083_0582 [Dialister micraerophilus DSM 19965]